MALVLLVCFRSFVSMGENVRALGDAVRGNPRQAIRQGIKQYQE